mgnify:CR=1 FL=1
MRRLDVSALRVMLGQSYLEKPPLEVMRAVMFDASREHLVNDPRVAALLQQTRARDAAKHSAKAAAEAGKVVRRGRRAAALSDRCCTTAAKMAIRRRSSIVKLG